MCYIAINKRIFGLGSSLQTDCCLEFTFYTIFTFFDIYFVFCKRERERERERERDG